MVGLISLHLHSKSERKKDKEKGREKKKRTACGGVGGGQGIYKGCNITPINVQDNPIRHHLVKSPSITDTLHAHCDLSQSGSCKNAHRTLLPVYVCHVVR